MLATLTGANADVTAGISIVLRALEAPIRQIAENSGVEGSIVVGKLMDGKDPNQGFDAQTEAYVDMIKAGIVDPAKVVRTALQDAGSIAALLITAEAMIADAPAKDAASRRQWRRHGRLLNDRLNHSAAIGRATEPKQQPGRSTSMAAQNNSKQSLAQRWEDYQPTKSTLVMACAATAVATMIIGFNWGGWVTGGTSRTLANTAGDVARGELASVICVERFKAAPDSAAKLTELKAITDSYKKRQFVETGGWATMPGADLAQTGWAHKAARSLSPPDILFLREPNSSRDREKQPPGHLPRRAGRRQGDRSMIAFVPKPNAVAKTKVAEESRFDRIRRLADKQRKADTGTIRRDPQKTSDKRPM